jgi:cytochrome c biogenesis protein ResB
MKTLVLIFGLFSLSLVGCSKKEPVKEYRAIQIQGDTLYLTAMSDARLLGSGEVKDSIIAQLSLTGAVKDSVIAVLTYLEMLDAEHTWFDIEINKMPTEFFDIPMPEGFEPDTTVIEEPDIFVDSGDYFYTIYGSKSENEKKRFIANQTAQFNADGLKLKHILNFDVIIDINEKKTELSVWHPRRRK